jgi:predicted nuclease of predicted toxin-antitoxin system
MRLLLDECLPKDLARELTGHTVKTVPQAGWASISNGKLLGLVAASGAFDAFITVDKNLPHQNKIQDLPFAIIVVRARSNRLIHLTPFVSEILRLLPVVQPGHLFVLTQPAA